MSDYKPRYSGKLLWLLGYKLESLQILSHLKIKFNCLEKRADWSLELSSQDYNVALFVCVNFNREWRRTYSFRVTHSMIDLRSFSWEFNFTRRAFVRRLLRGSRRRNFFSSWCLSQKSNHSLSPSWGLLQFQSQITTTNGKNFSSNFIYFNQQTLER